MKRNKAENAVPSKFCLGKIVTSTRSNSGDSPLGRRSFSKKSVWIALKTAFDTKKVLAALAYTQLSNAAQQERRLLMRKRWIAAILAAVMTLTLFSGCGGGGTDENGVAKNDYPVSIGGVTFDQSPERVVVLSPSMADVILAMGYEIKLVGRTEDCTQEDLSVLPTVGSSTAVAVDKIKELNPNLVLSDTALSESQQKELSDAGIKTLVLQPAKTREELELLYQNIGAVLYGGKTGVETAKKRIGSLLKTLDEMNRTIPESDIPVVACYLYDLTGTAVTGDSFGSKLIEYSGAINAFSGSTDSSVDLKDLSINDPTYIFCAPGVKAELAASETFKTLTAVKEGRVYEMEPSLIQWQGRTMLSGMEFMAGTMYPELMQGSSSPSSEPDSGSSQDEPSGSSQGEPPQSSQGDVPPSSSSATITVPAGTKLNYGDTGDEVKKMQNRLKELGYFYGTVNSTFDDETLRALKDFQFCSKMVASGVANADTLNALYDANALRREDYGQ